MKFIALGFHLGVVFAIFSFIWGLFQLGLALLRGVRPKTVVEEYLLRLLQYLFLVDVAFLFCLNREGETDAIGQEIYLTGFILLMYVVGKFQNKQNRIRFVQLSGFGFPQSQSLFNRNAEIAVICVAIAVFVSFIFYPDYARNPISLWFYETIIDIENTFFFGTLFKIIGLFVLLGLLIKMINGITFLLSGAPLMSVRGVGSDQAKKDGDDFDDFEEVN